MKAKKLRNPAAPKRYSDLAADFRRATVEMNGDGSVVERMNAAMKSMDDGRARAEGIASRGKTNDTREFCKEMARCFPRDFARFKFGEPLTGKRLRAMIEAVKTPSGFAPTLDAVRKHLTREIREGEKAAVIQRRSATEQKSNKAKPLDIRHGVLQLPPPLPRPPPVDVLELFPTLRGIRILK